MAPQTRTNPKENITPRELDTLGKAFKDPEFRQLLVEYSREINDPDNREKYEQELKAWEAERSGTELTFLHPEPGYVIKTWTLGSKAKGEEKVFINVCSDETVAKPESKREDNPLRPGVHWSIPHSMTKGRRDIDKAGMSCLVFDVIFHPNALALGERNQAMRGLVNDTALDAAEASGQVTLDRKKVRFPKLKFKGTFHPTVIRKEPAAQVQVPPQASGDGSDEGSPHLEPAYTVKYRYTSDLEDAALFQGGRQLIKDPSRPSEMVVEVMLPQMSSAKTVELDVEERKMTLQSTEPARYRLVLNFAYPVDEENGSAKFDKATKKLVITLPVKSSMNRLTSTDSGIDVDFDNVEDLVDIVKEDTAYRTYSDLPENVCNDDDDLIEIETDSKNVENDCQNASKEEDDNHLLFPTYTCNVYDELMVLKLDVKNVDEESVAKTSLDSNEGSGFSLRFTTLGSGMVPLKYGFDMLFLFKEEEPSYSLDDLEVEIWDNNIIVQMALPMSDCSSYKVGSHPMNMKEHSLPQLRAFKQKRRQLMRSISTPEKYSSYSKQEDESNADKERHSSGDSALSVSPTGSNNSGFCSQVSANQQKSAEMLACGMTAPSRGILKYSNARGRCFSESGADHFRLMASASLTSCISNDSSIPEEQDDAISTDIGSSVGSKKCVRFSEIVHRQVFRSNSSILGQKMKNTKKAEQKKRRALERRVSEGDAENFSGSSSGMQKSGSWMGMGCSKNSDENSGSPSQSVKGDEESQTDSGVASSMEDTSNFPRMKNPGKKGVKPKCQTKKKGSGEKSFLKEANTDLIFALDF